MKITNLSYGYFIIISIVGGCEKEYFPVLV